MNHKAILMAAIALVAVLAIIPSDTSEGARAIEIEDGHLTIPFREYTEF